MALLLDTHIFISMSRYTLELDYPKLAQFIADTDDQLVLSAASIWEITIKTEIGKLASAIEPHQLEKYCLDAAISVLPVYARHASFILDQPPQTRDPFDRMLLSQCAVEKMKLVTADRSLVGHPLVVGA